MGEEGVESRAVGLDEVEHFRVACRSDSAFCGEKVEQFKACLHLDFQIFEGVRQVVLVLCKVLHRVLVDLGVSE